jgi:hypothetical protein
MNLLYKLGALIAAWWLAALLILAACGVLYWCNQLPHPDPKPPVVVSGPTNGGCDDTPELPTLFLFGLAGFVGAFMSRRKPGR